MRIFIILFVLATLGCGKVLIPEEEAHQIVIEAQKIFDEEGIIEFKIINVSKDTNPFIYKLGSEDIILREEGLYIPLSRGFVSEKGYFIPTKNTDLGSLNQYDDPSYDFIYECFYSYEIKG